MTQVNFGVGSLFGTRTDIATQTPAPFGIIQDVEIDFSFSLKELVGQYQTPIAIARGAHKITGKAKIARIYNNLYQSLFFAGSQSTTANVLLALSEAHPVPGSPSYTVTVTNSGTFLKDQGVYYSSTGVQLTRVAGGAEATGKYSVNEGTGVYTFAAGDASAALLFNYSYTASGGATKISYSNQLMGSGPTFRILLANIYNSQVMNLELNACVAGKLNFPFKNQDFTIQDFEFEALADSAGNVFTLTTTE